MSKLSDLATMCFSFTANSKTTDFRDVSANALLSSGRQVIRFTNLKYTDSYEQWLSRCRYVDTLSKHMHECVLDKLEKAYDSMVKQAASSEDNDMSIHFQKVAEFGVACTRLLSSSS